MRKCEQQRREVKPSVQPLSPPKKFNPQPYASTDGVEPRPVATKGPDGEWAVTVHPVGNLSLSFDHRAVDGAYAAAFLAAVRTTLETRDWADEL